jgi:site-specific recombinase XerD
MTSRPSASAVQPIEGYEVGPAKARRRKPVKDGTILRKLVTLRAALKGTAMTRSGFEYVLDKHVRKAAEVCPALGGRTVSPHQLRHSCAVIMLQATRDIRKVALWLGHADIRTTEVYLRMDPSEKLEAVEAVVPPELRRGRFKAPDSLIASLLREVTALR